MSNALKLNQKVIRSLMQRARVLAQSCPETCRDFRIMRSPLRSKTLILRWTAIDLSDEDKPTQCFRYECFHRDGRPQHCSVHYSDVNEANAFFDTLETLYRQTYPGDG